MKKLLVYYNFIVVTTFVLLALFNARTSAELIAGALFSPLLIYFILLVVPRKNRALLIEKKTPAVQKTSSAEPPSFKMPGFDMDRRLFLKLIASSGVSLFLFSLLNRKAENAFLRAADNPTATAKSPMDDYQIAEIDDSIPTFYGYINKDGAWFIRKEDENNSFRYAKGSSNFAVNWVNRALLSYNYFNIVF